MSCLGLRAFALTGVRVGGTRAAVILASCAYSPGNAYVARDGPFCSVSCVRWTPRCVFTCEHACSAMHNYPLLSQYTAGVFPVCVYVWCVCDVLLCVPGRSVRPRRTVEAANPKEFEYLEGSIPSEWDGKLSF